MVSSWLQSLMYMLRLHSAVNHGRDHAGAWLYKTTAVLYRREWACAFTSHDGKARPWFSRCSQSENSDSFCASLMFTLKTLLWNKCYTYRNNNVIMSRTWLKNNRKINAWTHSHLCRHGNCFISIERKDVEWFLARRPNIIRHNVWYAPCMLLQRIHGLIQYLLCRFGLFSRKNTTPNINCHKQRITHVTASSFPYWFP